MHSSEHGGTVALYKGDTAISGATGIVSRAGGFATITISLAEGTHILTATVTDEAGNVSAKSPSSQVKVDTIDPTLSVAIAGPTQGAGTVTPTVVEASPYGREYRYKVIESTVCDHTVFERNNDGTIERGIYRYVSGVAISLAASDNNQYFCFKAEDLAGNIVYRVSAQITGITHVGNRRTAAPDLSAEAYKPEADIVTTDMVLLHWRSAPTNYFSYTADDVMETWKRDGDLTSLPIASYEVSYVANGVTRKKTQAIHSPGSHSNSVYIRNLEPGTAYAVTVRVIDSEGNKGVSSPSLTVTTLSDPVCQFSEVPSIDFVGADAVSVNDLIDSINACVTNSYYITRPNLWHLSGTLQPAAVIVSGAEVPRRKAGTGDLVNYGHWVSVDNAKRLKGVWLRDNGQ